MVYSKFRIARHATKCHYNYKHSLPRGGSSPHLSLSLGLIFTSFCWIDYCNLSYGPLILSTAGLCFHTMDFSIMLREHINHSTHIPLSTFHELHWEYEPSTCTYRVSVFHFFCWISDRNTSLVQRFQNESTIFWTNSTLTRGFLVCLNGPWGTWFNDCPSQKMITNCLLKSNLAALD